MSTSTLSPELRALAETALAHQNAKRFAEAAQAYNALLSRAPQLWAACYNLALVYQHLQRLPDAANMYSRAVGINPEFAEGYNNLGNVLKAMKSESAAIDAYRKALALNPQLADASYNLATMLQAQGKANASIGAFREAVTNNPAHGEAWDSLYRTLLGLGQKEEAIQAFLDWERLCVLSPEMVVAGLALCRSIGDPAREARYLSLALEWPFAEFTPAQFAPVLGMIQYFDVRREDLLACYRHYDSAMSARQPAIIPLLSRRAADSRLRIGYVSGDFRQHVMGRIMLDVIARHDRSQFSVLLISTCPRSQHDSITAAFRQIVDGFADVSELDDFSAAKSIAEADIDVLVDLAGHTDSARPGIYAHRPARSIVTHLGYHGCLGLSAIDFKFGDRIAEPDDAAAFQIEHPYLLDSCVFPFVRVPPADVELGQELNLSGKFVFGAFLNVLKLSPRCLNAWAQVLEALPEAVLLFSPLNADERFAIERIVAAAGIDVSRVIILNVTQRDERWLRARYRLVDAVMDTFPYAGGDTTLAALDVGVPVVTLAGKRHSERIGASILGHLGMNELVTESEADFVALAIKLARNADFMTEVRQRLVTAIEVANRDVGVHIRALEKAFISIASQKPAESNMNLTARQFFQALYDAMRRQRIATDEPEQRAIAATFAELRLEQPDYPPLLRAQGELAQSMKDMPLAADCLSALLQRLPGDIDASLALAGFLVAQNAAVEALKVIDDAMIEAGTNVRALKLQTRAHAQLRQWPTARQFSAAAVAIAPSDSDVMFWHGTVLSHLGEFEAALNYLNRTLILAPDHAEAAYNAGVLLAELGNHADAEKVFRRALGTAAASLAHKRLLHSLQMQRRRSEWLVEAQRFTGIYSGLEYSRLLESRIARYRGDLHREAEILLPLAEQAAMLENDVVVAELLNDLLAFLPCHDVSPRLLERLHRRFVEAMAKLHPPATDLQFTAPQAVVPLKVGYLVDFSLPLINEFVHGIAASRDRSRFDMSIYAMSPASLMPSSMYENFGVKVVQLAGFDEHRAAETIRTDRVDVLIDASAFGPYAKPGVFSYRPARVQLALPGFTKPVAAGDFDFRLSDHSLDLKSGTDVMHPAPCFIEGCALPLFPAPASPAPLARAQLGLATEVPVFGVIASIEHLSLRGVALWKSLADRVPEAVFLLCAVESEDVEPMRKILASAGIQATRILSLPLTFSAPRGSSLSGLVDIILDTVPGSSYSSVRASLNEAIPIVTTPGRMPDERVAFSMLNYLGEISTVATSGRDYVDIAAQLATDPDRRRSWSSRVRGMLQDTSKGGTPFSASAYVRQLEAAIHAAVYAEMSGDTGEKAPS